VSDHRIFRSLWWLSNALLIVTIATTAWTGVREYSVRQYLKGFSDAIIPEASSPQQKAEAILSWMRLGPPRLEAANTADLSPHDPEDTLNYRQLLEVCGSATNAFLNLSRSSGLQARRLLLLTPERTTKHVVAEVLLDGKWVIVDATYRIFLKDPQGNYLTRQDLKNPEVFRAATSLIPGYVQIYSYENFAHVRIPALPMHGFYIRRTLDALLPGWDEHLDWSLLLERRSFLLFFFSTNALILSFLARMILAWFADHRLRIPRFRLRTNLSRATSAFFTSPEIK
jgi:Transglutaminase-like superfamily